MARSGPRVLGCADPSSKCQLEHGSNVTRPSRSTSITCIESPERIRSRPTWARKAGSTASRTCGGPSTPSPGKSTTQRPTAAASTAAVELASAADPAACASRSRTTASEKSPPESRRSGFVAHGQRILGFSYQDGPRELRPRPRLFHRVDHPLPQNFVRLGRIKRRRKNRRQRAGVQVGALGDVCLD